MKLKLFETATVSTAEAARELLANRAQWHGPVNQKYVDHYARDMASGRWLEGDGMPPIIAAIGPWTAGATILVDGVHRLHALVKYLESGAPNPPIGLVVNTYEVASEADAEAIYLMIGDRQPLTAADKRRAGGDDDDDDDGEGE